MIAKLKVFCTYAFLFITFTSPCYAEDLTTAKYLYNYDGDTVSFDMEGLPDVFGKNISVRVYGIDTPEIKSYNPCEKQLAIVVREFVHEELSTAKVIVLKDCKRDKYFRVLARIEYDGKDLTTELLKHGYGYEYYGDTKKKLDYCKQLFTKPL